MDGEHTPETDLTRCHQVLEERDKFETSILRLDRCCFLALLRVDTHLLWTFSVGFAFKEDKASCNRATASSQDSVYHGQLDGYDN